MEFNLEKNIIHKMRFLNEHGIAVIFAVTGGNGTGKSVISKALLTNLPFHQTFNLGAITKTIRYLNEDLTVTKLENFEDKNINNLFTPIVQYSCAEYQRNGVNVIIDGVQINTKSSEWEGLIAGGVIMSVDKRTKLQRNDLPDTHFKRKINIDISDHYLYESNKMFTLINNSYSFDATYHSVLAHLNTRLEMQMSAIKLTQVGAL